MTGPEKGRCVLQEFLFIYFLDYIILDCRAGVYFKKSEIVKYISWIHFHICLYIFSMKGRMTMFCSLICDLRWYFGLSFNTDQSLGNQSCLQYIIVLIYQVTL